MLASEIGRHIGKQGIVIQVRSQAASCSVIILNGSALMRQRAQFCKNLGQQQPDPPCLQDGRQTLTMITPDNQLLRLTKKGGRFEVPLSKARAMVLNGDAMAS